jgi:hypothetical protein
MEGSEKFSDHLDEDQVRSFVDEVEAETGPMSAEERARAEANVRGFFEVGHMLALRIQQEETGQLDPAEMIRQQEIAMLNLGEPPEAIQEFHERTKLQDSFMKQWRDEEMVVRGSGLSLMVPAVNRLPVNPTEGGYVVMSGEQIEAATTAEDRRHTEAVLSALEHAAILLDQDLSLKRIREIRAEESLETITKRAGWHCLFRSRFFEQQERYGQALKLQRQAFGELLKAGDLVGAGYARYREIIVLTMSDQGDAAERKATALVSFVAKHQDQLGDRPASALLWMIHEYVDEACDAKAFQSIVRAIEKHDLVAFMEDNNLRSSTPGTVEEMFGRRT